MTFDVKLFGRVGALAVVVFLGGAQVAGCSSPTEGAAKAGEVDVRTLEVGDYSTEPLDVPRNDRESFGRLIEAVRIADAVADPYKIDPDLKYWSGAEPRPDAKSATGTLADATQPVLEKYGMIAGFAVGGRDQEFPAEGKPKVGDARAVTINVLRFPDEDSAGRAAREIDAVDFALSPENRAVEIPEYDAAQSHWRPGVPSLGSTIARGFWVVNVYAEHTSADLDALTDLVTKTFDAQLPLLDSFDATPADKVATLPLDAEGMVRRILPYQVGVWPYPVVESDDPSTIVESGNVSIESGIAYGRLGATHSAGNKEVVGKLFDETGLEFWGAVEIGTFLYRVRDKAAAERLVAENYGDSPNITNTIDGPKGVPDATCQELQTYTGDPYYRCSVIYRQYAASVTSNDEDDVRFKAAAQYALLANSQ
ncbi:hypothetical protein ACHIPZ_06010 [Antrihabitans sp. NCIMB 15449]|uniref:Uncharacterized protein n=1 Tax=Antrihabitans spumae TaxID=3373370 RepID=A0ABW7JIH4_9NOCA